MLARLLEHPRADRDDQAGLLGERDELARREQAPVGVLPAHQRLHPDQPAAGERQLRLEVDDQLVLDQRAAKVVLEVKASGGTLEHHVVEQRGAPAAGLLGAVHRGVGVADQLVGAAAERGGGRDADAGVREHLLAAAERERPPERLQDALGDGDGVALVAEVLAQDRELVAAEAGHQLVAANGRAQPLSGRGEQLVAGPVAEAVVDELEAVEVEEQHRHGPGLAVQARERGLQAVREQHAGSAGW